MANNNNKKRKPGVGISFYVFLIVMALAILTFAQNAGGPPKDYTDLYKAIKAEQVKELSVSDTHATALLKDNTKLSVAIPSLETFNNDLGDVVRKQMDNGTLKVSSAQASAPWWFSALPTLFTIAFIIAFWFMIQRMQGGGGKGGNSFGKSRAKIAEKEKTSITFKDVAGEDEAKEELEEIVEFLRLPKKFTDLGARIPRGVLLVGPPGTGKTLLAKAVAGEAGVPFFSISGSDFVEMFVGVGASRVRDLFEQAKKQAPSIIFIDEIDAVGRHRGAGMGGGHDEREQTLNQLLVEMDGFGINQGVIIIAATNRPDILDPALLRPGRFDRQVTVAIPDVLGREEILHVHTAKKPLAGDVDLKILAKTTTGFSGADLENLANEAALLAARKDKRKIHMQDFEESIIKVIAGPEKKTRVMMEKERKLTAYHEAGHAVITRLMPTAHPVHQISIIPRGMAGGYTLSLPKDDKYYNSKNEMEENIVTLLGGRVAEKVVLDDISTGASNDIQRATKIARDMVTRYGMSDKLGTVSFDDENSEVFLGRGFAQSKNYSETVATQIDSEIRRIIDEAYKKCEKLLIENRAKLNAVAERLLETEKIESDEFEELFNAN
ncbi:ATP-dependent zinc metalloprotease FtsH [Clostridia bacterium]|nr:ATP-dependent zinc metalloprotease FtsH [Clostridia bacterium]